MASLFERVFGPEDNEHDGLAVERLMAVKETSAAIAQLAFAMNNLALAIDRHACSQYINHPPADVGKGVQ